jgi:FtsP/CotA-like multicopper oxidase with cupredoxin domain
MPRTQSVSEFRCGSAERYEFLIDFSKYPTGTRIELRNLSNKNNRDYTHTNKVMAFDVTDEPVDTSGPSATMIPGTLSTDNDVMDLQPSQAVKTRSIRVERSDSSNLWSLNGQTWDDVVDSGYKKVIADPDLNAVEIWNIQNNSGGWFHPVHIHLIDFKIIGRTGGTGTVYKHELGPKDVMYVGEGETVKVLMKFGPHRGRYMIHCHNLPHEDHDMMHQFSVGMKESDFDEDPNDPIWADPAKNE